MQQTIRPFIAFIFLTTIAAAASLFLIRKIERVNHEIDSVSFSFPIVQSEGKISEEEFFSVQDNNIDTKSWKVYTDKKYGFQFRYPNDLELGLSSSYSDAGGERGITLGSKNFPTENFWMSMGVFEGYKAPQELYEYLVGGAAPGEIIQTLETTINGHRVYLGKESGNGGVIDYAYAISLSDETILWIIQRLPGDMMDSEWKNLPIGQTIIQSLSFN